MQYTVTRCNTLQHAATCCNTLHHVATCCNTLQHAATCCNMLQHAATRCNMLQHAATRSNMLQHAATRCNTLQQRPALGQCCKYAVAVAAIYGVGRGLLSVVLYVGDYRHPIYGLLHTKPQAIDHTLHHRWGDLTLRPTQSMMTKQWAIDLTRPSARPNQ